MNTSQRRCLFFEFQYQRELALQQIRNQERELHMRQEQQKQQYRLGGPYGPHPFMVPSQGTDFK